MNKQPLYQQIKSYIQDNIDSGNWPIGFKIAPEVQLAEQFRVSRMTVNKAIQDLVNEGLLTRKPRAGTIVCLPNKLEKAESPLMEIRNIADEIKNRGQEYSCKVIELSRINADHEVAMRLGVMFGSPVFFSKIIHFSDRHPLQVEIRWVNPIYAPDYLAQNFSVLTPNHYLSECCPLSAIEHTVEAIMPDEQIAQLLAMNVNEPCLLLNRRTWSDGKLISSALLYHPANKYKLSSKVTF